MTMTKIINGTKVDINIIRHKIREDNEYEKLQNIPFLLDHFKDVSVRYDMKFVFKQARYCSETVPQGPTPFWRSLSLPFCTKDIVCVCVCQREREMKKKPHQNKRVAQLRDSKVEYPPLHLPKSTLLSKSFPFVSDSVVSSFSVSYIDDIKIHHMMFS